MTGGGHHVDVSYTWVLRLPPTKLPTPRQLNRLQATLQAGGLVAFPTETVYGLGALARLRRAVARLRSVKGRPPEKPFTLLAPNIGQARALAARWPANAQRLAQKFWPGPLTLVVPAAAHIPTTVTAGRATVGIRVSSHPVVQALLQAVGEAVAAPSANFSGGPSPTGPLPVLKDFAGCVDVIIDAGPTAEGRASTVVDLTDSQPLVLREGSVKLKTLQKLLPEIKFHPQAVLADNGLKERGVDGHHGPEPQLSYLPRATVTLVLGKDKERVHTMLQRLARPVMVAGLQPGFILEKGAKGPQPWPGQQVYWHKVGSQMVQLDQVDRTFRQLESLGVQHIFAHNNNEAGISAAVRNRFLQVAEHIYRLEEPLEGLPVSAAATPKERGSERGRLG